MKLPPVIVLISTVHTPFVQDDIDSLSKIAQVQPVIGSGIRQVVNVILGVLRCDVVFCWFASTYAGIAVWLAKRLHLKTIVVVGGVDVAKIDELNYGIWVHPLKARFAGYALRNADHVLPVDPSLAEEARLRAAYDGRNITSLPTGFDSNYWKPMGAKEAVILTVAFVHDRTRMRVKGIDTLFDAARLLTGYEFVIVGIDDALARQLKPPSNVLVHGPMDRPKLLAHYRRAKVYCQPSLREGLSNALCEAMLCACIPVATEVGGTRTAVADTGLLVRPGNPDALGRSLRQAMEMPERKGAQARTRIVGLFPREKREAELARLIGGGN